MIAGDARAGCRAPGTWRQISIFLSPMDVHVNRAPVSGRRDEGGVSARQFLPAYRREAATDNERNEVWIDHDGPHGRLPPGRRHPGAADRVPCAGGGRPRAGQRFGVMKFGSRIDLFLPPGSTLRVTVGDRVQAGVTVLATLPSARPVS